MSAPPSGSASGSSTTAGYYPDPSIPGYIRYWDGASWVPGTSRPEPRPGEPTPTAPGEEPRSGGQSPEGGGAPASAPPESVDAVPAQRTDSPQEPPAGGLPELRPRGDVDVRESGQIAEWDDPARLHGQRPESAPSWQADAGRQSGFGGEQDQRISWGSPADRGEPGGGWQRPQAAPPGEAPAQPGRIVPLGDLPALADVHVTARAQLGQPARRRLLRGAAVPTGRGGEVAHLLLPAALGRGLCRGCGPRARLHGQRPESAPSWQADAGRQSGFGGEQDQRISWGSPRSAGEPQEMRWSCSPPNPLCRPASACQDGADSGRWPCSRHPCRPPPRSPHLKRRHRGTSRRRSCAARTSSRHATRPGRLRPPSRQPRPLRPPRSRARGPHPRHSPRPRAAGSSRCATSPPRPVGTAAPRRAGTAWRHRGVRRPATRSSGPPWTRPDPPRSASGWPPGSSTHW
ncbi:DUF2510 domain-containing protein [Streptomyces sp. P38-E01]|uniref:DUF2510 domain-containing protein n=1 Tax=Streptomyces tardus TaxID=2780544 RepID=A0A949JEX3_9ACTN|nr:DUF2510 domain-containing protein [Streptomyces tardus]